MDTRRIVRWMWLPAAAAVLYTGVVMAMRWQEDRDLERQAVQQQAEADRAIVERYGNGELKLLSFYANPPEIRAGTRSLLCYGVANAKAVAIEPPVDGVSPSLSRCVEVRPKASATYTLTATGANGAIASKSVTVTVR